MPRIETTPVFAKHVRGRLAPESLTELYQALAANPAAGQVMPGTKGVRKLRWAAPGRGKRGGFRVLYYWDTRNDRVVLLALYPKNEWENPPDWVLKQWLKHLGK